MLDLADPQTITAVDTPVLDRIESDTVETFELEDRPQEPALAKAPIATAFALLAGGFFTALGIVGFLPIVTANNVLLGFFQVTPAANVLHLLTGLAGLAAGGYAFRTRRESSAVAYAAAMVVLYIVVFSIGNIAFGNAEGRFDNRHALFLHLLAIRDLPLFMANGLHITFAMASLFVASAAALQKGARASARRGTRRIREYRSRTLIRQPDLVGDLVGEPSTALR